MSISKKKKKLRLRLRRKTNPPFFSLPEPKPSSLPNRSRPCRFPTLSLSLSSNSSVLRFSPFSVLRFDLIWFDSIWFGLIRFLVKACMHQRCETAWRRRDIGVVLWIFFVQPVQAAPNIPKSSPILILYAAFFFIIFFFFIFFFWLQRRWSRWVVYVV